MMSDLSVADFRRKKERKVENMESTREEQELKEQKRLDEEEIEFGTLDDRKEEADDYASSPKDESEAYPKFDPRTREQKFDDALQTENLESSLRVEAMFTDVEENQTGFDFDFDGAHFHGHDYEWLLHQVFISLQQTPNIRGVEFEDFNEEFERNTGLKLDLKALAKLLNQYPM